jgi:hypothetical protein
MKGAVPMIHPRWLLSIVAFAAGCRTDLLPGPGDGAPVDAATTPADAAGAAIDLTAPAGDLSTLSCATLQSQIAQLSIQYQSCQADTDCVSIAQAGPICGCTILDATGAAIFMKLALLWTRLGCPATICGDCPLTGLPAICQQGICLAGPPPGLGGPCQSSAQCPSEGQYAGTCLTGAPFTDGDCVLPCAHGFGCPSAGMTCLPQNGAPGHCFQSCRAQTDCRNGYLCCPASMGQPDICYPGPNCP